MVMDVLKFLVQFLSQGPHEVTRDTVSPWGTIPEVCGDNGHSCLWRDVAVFPVGAIRKGDLGDLVAVHSLRDVCDLVCAFRECVGPSAAVCDHRVRSVNQVSM